MKRRFMGLFLVVVLLMGVAGTSLAAVVPPPLPFGEELMPLTHEEMEDVEGAWGTYAAAAVMGAALGGLSYYTTTSPAERNWSDGLKACALGAVGTLIGKFL
ncbi:MAG TPA: hypothetical protein GXZ85_01870 [Firmicutes bacterium]|nr:hypothetical protein [Bacillota bacterium]